MNVALVKRLAGNISAGLSTSGSYLLGILMGVPPTESITSVMGSVGWVICAVLFAGGFFGINYARGRHETSR